MQIRLSPTFPSIEVLYQDEAMLAVNKPAGLLVAPDRWDKKKENLMGLLRAAVARRDPWVVSSGIKYLANVHRLDRETSGVLLLAKSKTALSALFQSFREQKVKKIYVALARGSLSEDPILVQKPIASHGRKPGFAIINIRWGKKAETLLSGRESFRRHTLVQAEPRTGRLHQVRVHLQAAGCALVADPDYGDMNPILLSDLKPGYKKPATGETPLIARPALHAESLTVVSPATGKPVKIEAPWPKDLALTVKYLRKFSAL